MCVSRAVANLSTLSEYCLPYVKVGGCFIAYKAGQLDEELKSAERAVKLLGGEIADVHRLTLPDTDIDRTFVVIKRRQPPLRNIQERRDCRRRSRCSRLIEYSNENYD